MKIRKDIFIEKYEIFKLKDKNCNVTFNRQQILEAVEDFYKELYRNRQSKNNNPDSVTIIKNKLMKVQKICQI